MNIEEKKADFMRRFKASRERKAEYIAPVSYTHLDVYKRQVWSHGQFAQRRVLFRLDDVTSASPCRSGRLFIEAVHQLIDTGIHTQMCIRDSEGG